MTARERLCRAGASVALAAVVIVVALVATGCGDDAGAGAARHAGTTATASSRESPTEVVAAYRSALQAGDVDCARARTTDRFADETDAINDSWYHQGVRFSRVSLGEPTSATGSATAERFTEAVYVPARFDLTQSDPVSLPNGPTVWGFLLGRNRATDAWRIDGEGGP